MILSWPMNEGGGFLAALKGSMREKGFIQGEGVPPLPSRLRCVVGDVEFMAQPPSGGNERRPHHPGTMAEQDQKPLGS